MRKIIKLFAPYKGYMFGIFSLLALGTVADLIMPLIMSNIVNDGINKANLGFIINQSIIMSVVSGIGLICLLFAIKLRTKVMAKFAADLRNSVFAKINSLSYQQFTTFNVGSLLTRATEDVWMLKESFSQLSSIVVSFPIFFIGGIVLSFGKDWVMSLLIFLFAPIIVIFVARIGKNLVPRWEASEKYSDKQNNLMRERLSGIRVIRAFNSENIEHDKLADATVIMADNIIKANITSGIISPFAMLMLDLAMVLILYLGALRIGNGSSLLTGDIVAIIQYVVLMLNSIIVASFGIIFFPRISVAVRRINEIFDAPDISLSEGQHNLIAEKGDIKFENVSFRYDGAENNVVTDINIDIQSGQTAAFIGGTGSGKSTLIQLLMGFFPPQTGEIYIDSTATSTCNKESIRNNLSLCQQKSSIFMGTIGENIRLGDQNADDNKLKNVCQIAQIDDFINTLDNAYAFELEQGGSNLSGGQKQRINIARTIIKESPIYIFDDSFSALDFLTESKLRKRLNKYLSGKTQLIVTQRISTAMSADTIYVLDNGQIVGSGTHKQLIKTCEIYRQIYSSQIGGEL